MDRDIELHQRTFGTTVDWYFYDPVHSTFDDVYDEGQDLAGTGGRRWRGPVTLPVLSANRTEGTKVTTDDGMYVLDTIDLRMGYEQARRVGLVPEISQNQETHYSDRFIYDNLVWGIRDIQIRGQFEPSGRDMMVRVLGVRLRPDELVNDVDFVEYSASAASTTTETGGHLDITIEAGATFELSLTYEDDNGAPASLAGMSARMQIRPSVESPIVLLSLHSGPGGGITLAPVGNIDLRIGAGDTEQFGQYAGYRLAYDLELFDDADPTQVDRIVYGDVMVSPEVTQ